MENKKKVAIIIGAGPAGLTAAWEFMQKKNIHPILLEQDNIVGGISRTANYKGNRIDIGGHRFFSKSKTVMDWWNNILPLQGKPSADDIKLNRKVPLLKDGPDPESVDQVMLFRNRLSRIFFLRNFFDYPISLNLATMKNLGLIRIIKIGFSYVWANLFPNRNETNLEDFFINRFGKELYLTFFKDYTEKVWGTSCKEISSEWGAQRIKGLSITKALIHSVKNIFIKTNSIEQQNTETSLIEQFMYPKFGPGHLWETVLSDIIKEGGEIHYNWKVEKLNIEKNKVTSVVARNSKTSETKIVHGDYFISTMPIKDLVNGVSEKVTEEVKEVANGLVYIDFITVGLLCKKLQIHNKTEFKTMNNIIPDTWIYIQEKDVKLGRLQIFNNWSPYLVSNPDYAWIGLEYFCNEKDELWNMSNENITSFAKDEIEKINIANKEDIIDSVVIRMPKTYPAYFGTYDRFDIVRNYLDGIENLFLAGRNGMHRYNNQDHSMLTAITVVKNIHNNVIDKNNIWEINTEQEYHEEK